MRRRRRRRNRRKERRSKRGKRAIRRPPRNPDIDAEEYAAVHKETVHAAVEDTDAVRDVQQGEEEEEEDVVQEDLAVPEDLVDATEDVARDVP